MRKSSLLTKVYGYYDFFISYTLLQLSNLLKTTVNCENPNVFVFEEEDATNQALLLLLNRIKKASLWNKEPITFFSSLLKTRRYYFFAVR